MKSKLILSICLCLALVSPLFAVEKKGKSLVFDLPEGVKFEEKSDKQMEFYTITLKTDTMPGLLMIHASPVPASEEMLKPMAEMMRVSFEKAMKENTKFSIKDTKSETNEFKKGIWKGYETKFVGTAEGVHKILQLMFVLWDGKRLWNAQFTGQEQDYDSAIKILESIKLNEAATAGGSSVDKQ